jgi:hypothetical protein
MLDSMLHGIQSVENYVGFQISQQFMTHRRFLVACQPFGGKVRLLSKAYNVSVVQWEYISKQLIDFLMF